jgi:hypothetical protein
MLFAAAFALISSGVLADEAKFEKDRQAILSMAGDFKVGFRFQETLSLREGYEVRETPY